MSAMNRFTEVNQVLAQLAPITANGTVAAHSTGWFDIAEFHRVYAHLMVGTPAGASTIDMTLWEAENLDGLNAQQITSKAITQLAAADAGAYVGVEVQSENLDVDDKMHCLKFIVTVGTAAYTYGLTVFGLEPRYPPVDVTGFDEIVD